MNLHKPEKHWHIYAYDYHECSRYLEQRDSYSERNYAGWTPRDPEAAPYQDFWHFVCERAPDITNGSTFIMEEAWKEDATSWQCDILDKYLTTFGETDPSTGERYIEFYVDW